MPRDRISLNWFQQHQKVVLCVVTLAAFILSGWVLAKNTQFRIQDFATSKIDNVQWNTTQTEVDAFEFLMAVSLVNRGEPADLNHIRRRFDILYSRIDIMVNGSNFATLRELPEVQQPLGEIVKFIAEVEKIIDSDDATLNDALPTISVRAVTMRSDVRNIALTSITHHANQSKLQRKAVVDALISLGIFAGCAFFGLVFFLTKLTQSNRREKKKTAELIHAKAHQQSIIGTSIDAIIVTDRLGSVIEFNGAAEGMFGFSADEALGNQMADLIIPPGNRENHAIGMQRYLLKGEKVLVGKELVQTEAMHKSGRVFPVELKISPNQSNEGEVFVAFIRDISNWVEARTELEVARDQALAGERAKADMLAVMSHEIRTPLNGILGTLDLLERTALTDDQVKYTGIMKTSGKMLTDHVNNVLDISRADAGKLEMATKSFDPIELVNEVIDSQREVATQRGNTLRGLAGNAPSGLVSGDPTRLRQVLVNLIGNAIKFTRGGKIEIDVERRESSDALIFRVKDTGIGIPDSDLDSIFGDFVTLDTSYDREVAGTGLGLGIVKRLIQAMKGKISVESVIGVGSVFQIELPMPFVTSVLENEGLATTASGGLTSSCGISALVVEDNEINRLVIREMLVSIGCKVTVAQDGCEGVARATEQPFDLILMDISMPKLDGVAAAMNIRDGNGPNALTPIFALTAHTLPEDFQRFRSAGMAQVLTKPINMARLKESIDQIDFEMQFGPHRISATKSA